ncbi:LLM class flavin-dependent oxidoreductase [soil metagenome]
MTAGVTRPRIGTVFVPGWAPELLRPVAAAADSSGIDDLWFWEDCFNESGPALASTALALTETVRVGVGLMPVPLRNVALSAMEIATMQRLFPGRFVPVIGHGVQRWMAQVGAKARSPLTLLTEYAVALRRLLAGESVSVDGDYVHLDEVQLRWPPAAPVQLMIGGEGPKTLALAATYGDGTMLTSALSDERIRESCDIVRATIGDTTHEIVGHLMVFRGAGAEARLTEHLATWPTGSTGIAAEGAEGAATVAAAIDRVAGFGMTTVLVHSIDEEPDPVGFVEWLGHDVMPLVAYPKSTA